MSQGSSLSRAIIIGRRSTVSVDGFRITSKKNNFPFQRTFQLGAIGGGGGGAMMGSRMGPMAR